MRQVQTPVQPLNPLPDGTAHPRAGQAGRVSSVPANDPDHVGVTWDEDGATTTELCANLRSLGQA